MKGTAFQGKMGKTKQKSCKPMNILKHLIYPPVSMSDEKL